MVVSRVIVASMMVALALAGCAGESDEPENTVIGTTEGIVLKEGKGAIAGLLIDDRFRPIHLTDNPENEFQRDGFVLLQETGKQVQTDENGQFGFIDLDPGTYTLRVTADGHEAKPTKVKVTEGIFEEAAITARRIAINEGAILTEHYAAFNPCGIFFVALSMNLGCVPDSSGDTSRSAFSVDYSPYEDATWLVAEALFNNPPKNGEHHEVVIREGFDLDFGSKAINEGNYIKLRLQKGAISPDEPMPGSHNIHWNNTGSMEMVMFGRGAMSEEIRTTYEPVYETMSTLPCSDPIYCASQFPMRRGAGVMLGVKATYLNSLFLGEPEVDPMEYCALCPA
ncbi:MAG: carboxypeptidase regulatory-like domain-containing protein [Thermoplasmatota archaeon]